jgi:hypothetical protein
MGETVTKRIISTTVYCKFKALLHLINFMVLPIVIKLHILDTNARKQMS